MDHTNITPSFVGPTTIQLRIELNESVDGVQTTDIPAGLSPNAETGWV